MVAEMLVRDLDKSKQNALLRSRGYDVNSPTGINVDIECSKIFVGGHNGMVGSAVMCALHKTGANNLLTADRAQLDLTNQAAVHSYMDSKQSEIVIIAAARVGGINANNTYPAEFIYQNLMMELNLIHGAYQSGCKRLLFLGTS